MDTSGIETISQRQLRNDNAAVMRAVEQGESYTVTRRGVPVARLRPVEAADELPCVKPARVRMDPAALRRVPASNGARATAEVLDELRGDR